MVRRMSRPAFALLLAAACGNPNNIVLGAVGATTTTPLIVFDSINSAISGTATLTDANGNPTGQSEVVIISDKSGLCSALQAHRDYFRNPPEAYEALVLFMPPGYLGTFVLGRGGDADQATSSEIIAGGTSGALAQFSVVNGGYVALTTWSDSGGGHASGSFDLAYENPNVAGAFEFSGRFQTDVCTTLDGTLLP